MSRLENNSDNAFSISNWIEQGEGTIFITNHASVKDTLKPILSLFIDLMGKKVLSLEAEVYRTNKTVNLNKKTPSLSTSARKEKLFLPSQSQGLPALTGIVKLYESDYLKVKWNYRDFIKKYKSFIIHKSMEL